MLTCAYCERPLRCDACGADYRPARAEDYDKLSWTEQPVLCGGCGQILVCRWCKTPYDGRSEGDGDSD